MKDTYGPLLPDEDKAIAAADGALIGVRFAVFSAPLNGYGPEHARRRIRELCKRWNLFAALVSTCEAAADVMDAHNEVSGAPPGDVLIELRRLIAEANGEAERYAAVMGAARG